MSYSSAPNYYGPSSTPQNTMGHATTGHGSERLDIYQDLGRSTDHNRQNHPTSNSYGWSYQAQANPTDMQYGDTAETWHDQSNTSASDNLPQNRYAPSKLGQTQNHSFPPRDPYNSQNAQGLNHLAYASGLEPQVTENNERSSHRLGKNVYGLAATGNGSQVRTSSPVSNVPEYSTTSSQLPPSARSSKYSSFQADESSTSVTSQNLARDAAAALAGAMRGVYPQSSRYVDNSRATQRPNSSGTSMGQYKPQSPSQRTTEPKRAVPSSQHVRKTSDQPRPSNPTDIQNSQVKAFSDTMKAPQSQPQQVILQNQAPTQNGQSQRQDQAPNPQDISNLVNATGNDSEEIYESIADQGSITNYINPTQVFNPYHREYERKKREAAELEARQRAEQLQRQDNNKQKANEQVTKRAPETLTAANSKSKITKKDTGKGSKRNDSNSQQQSINVTISPSEEDSMATEMQKMMSRMKEFRNTNPSLFQRLWNDMRGNASATVPLVGTTLQSPSPQATQISLPKAMQLPTGDERDPPSAKSTPKKPTNKGANNGVATDVPLNGFKVVVEDNAAGLPDLGRFPAERRIRQPYVKNKGDISAGASNGTVLQQTPQPLSEQSTSTTMQKFMEDSNGRPIESTSAWPELRREIVALALVGYLQRTGSNKDILITAQDVSLILKRNPTYLDLCTTLESKGFKFARTGLAKELLKAVPDLHAPSSKVASSSSNTDAGIITSSALPKQSPSVRPSFDLTNSTQTAPHADFGIFGSHPERTMHSQDMSVANPLNMVKTEQPKSAKHPGKSSKAVAVGFAKPEPPVGSKEAAARKRDFAELIDLTEIGEDDNYVLPTKQPRRDPESSSGFLVENQQSNLAMFNPNKSEPLKFNPLAQPRNLSSVSQPPQRPVSPHLFTPPYPSHPRFNVWSEQGFGRDGSKPRMILAKQLDRSKALQKSYYDPRTVARDILIASGRHKSERALNLHLAGLLGSYIELDSDVSTFDWDSIDPGGPPPSKVEYTDVPAAPPRFKLGEKTLRKHRKLGQPDKMRAPEVERPTSRPTSNSPNHHLSSEPPVHATHAEDEHGSTHRKSRKKGDTDLTAEKHVTPSTRNIKVDIPIGRSQQSAQPTSHRSSSLASKMDSDTPPTVKRRGRPPGAKNKYPSVAAMKQQARAAIAEVPVAEEVPEANLHSYRCKWVKCHAELHNLDTLRRHVTKKHRPKDDKAEDVEFVCWWKKCPYLEVVGTSNVQPTRAFANEEEWLRHIEEQHIHPVAVKYGDGPKTKDIDPQTVERLRTQYLSDSHGRATTPLTTPDGNADHPPDAMVLTKAYPQGPKSDREKADVTAQNAFMKAHGNRHRDTRKAAEEVVRAMEVRKQKIGPGLDRGGCTLINEARRSTFEQAPGVSRIVDADY